ncbi:hypothetical protein BH10BAC3_BH10BAC3_40440 [soil metagenome]
MKFGFLTSVLPFDGKDKYCFCNTYTKKISLKKYKRHTYEKLQDY